MFNNMPPVTRNLILLNVGLFLVTQFVFPNLMLWLAAFFPLSPNFRSWQILTHMFMHGGFAHLLFNMFTLWSFGPVLERILGQRKYVIFYFICGLGAFLIYNAWNYYQVYHIVAQLEAQNVNVSEIFRKASYTYSGDTGMYLPENADKDLVSKLIMYLQTPMVGASGAIFGVITAFGMLFPNSQLMLLFPPIPIKAKYLIPILIVGSLYLGFRQFDGDNVAHFAHLGGALLGFILVKVWKINQFRIR